MGEVYRADDLRLGQPVALKFLPENLRHDPVRLAQFHNEVRTARQVSHPNICRVYDIGEVDGHPYLSMEYVDGEDLASSLRRIGRFPEDKAVELARQLCSGLAAAHERGVLHRDLKPANVMLDGAGKVRVMDFGLAAVGPVADVRAGTPAYMAPEQLLGREVTSRSDIFALGLVLYELFTGRRAFTANTIGELVAQHEARSAMPPTQHISGLDPAIERAIQRCLESDPNRRPSSALAVAASLPGGDPLAAALAAGETPSPEMVAAAGEGTGLSARVALPVLVAIVAGIVGVFALSVRTSPLERVRPEYSGEVLAQKARDAIRQIGYTDAVRDAAYGFLWDDALIEHARNNEKPAPRWEEVLTRQPSPLLFWYRQSPFALTGLQFHHDLLTPGIVDQDDPPPILSGMVSVRLDHAGRLRFLEAIPQQRQEPAAGSSNVADWEPLLKLAGLDAAHLQPAEPLWTFLTTSDTRVAWTGTWPESKLPLRVEAAALRGKPVGFLLVAPWTAPWRTPSPSTGRETVFFIAILALIVTLLTGAGLLARKNLRENRGDRRSALHLAYGMTWLLLALWASQVHVVVSLGLFGTLFIAIATSVFYGVALWTIYLALEPFVRRHWPQALVSWTTFFTSGARDSIVGRDVLAGIGYGVTIAILLKGVELWRSANAMSYPGSIDVLLGSRGTAAVVLLQAAYALRSTLFFFFFLFLLRVLLRNQRVASVAFALVFGVLEGLGSEQPIIDGALAIGYFGLGAYVVLRFGLLSLTIALLSANLLANVPATLDFSAWYAANTLLIVGAIIVLAAWALYTSVGRQLLRKDLFA
jgi:serine/threonine-protein kinase